MIKFNLKYFIAFFLLLVIEIIIERYATGFIRHTLGDYLVVILLYCLIKGFLKISNLQNIFPKNYSRTVQIILGTSFSFLDLVAYSLGVLTVYLIDKFFKKH